MKINQQKQIKAFLTEEFGTTRNLQSNRQHMLCVLRLWRFLCLKRRRAGLMHILEVKLWFCGVSRGPFVCPDFRHFAATVLVEILGGL